MGEAKPPRTPSALPEWAEQVAEWRAAVDPRVSDAGHAVESTHTERTTTGERHSSERLALLAREYGPKNARAHQYGMRAHSLHRNVRARATLLRAESEEIRGKARICNLNAGSDCEPPYFGACARDPWLWRVQGEIL